MEDFIKAKSAAHNVVEETLERIGKQNGVTAVIVLNEDDLPIRTSVDGTLTMTYANTLRPIEKMARSAVRDLDPTNDLVLIRMRTRKNEIIIAPEQDNLLVVVQSSSE